MNSAPRVDRGRAVSQAALLTVCVTGMAACSPEAQEPDDSTAQVNYAIPESVCGVSTDALGLTPLFPPGDTIEESHHESSKRNSCYYDVDGALMLAIQSGIVADSSANPPQLRPENVDVEPVTVPGEHTAHIWPGQAYAVGVCNDGEEERAFMVLISSREPADPEASVELLSEVIHPVVDALEERCAELNDSGDLDSGSDD
ncbi:hypothetical protein [Streptomyces spiramenti]|uniref:DUF3558 domain-containing protein n=1 Tax=Streptomyces spiramenti TaxID=2720606 RepID=A0ABX1AP32_9ACTN|nr:hypothetical protein [Streptomyces spiramenti]NJP67891.1 hypothetical protein [Streptomyces spiramenti]